MACRDEYSKRKCDRRCVVCNEESVRVILAVEMTVCLVLVILEGIETDLETMY